MLRGLVAEVKAQEFAQTQAIGQPPGDPSFATDALAVANQKSSEIDAWRDARPTLDRLAKALAKLLGLEVELALCQNLVHLRLERMRRWFSDLFRRHPQLALLGFPSTRHHTQLDVSDILKRTLFQSIISSGC